MTRAPNARFSLRSVARSALILAGGATGFQLLALAREVFVAARVGVSPELDALLIAQVLPVAIAGILTTGATDSLLPQYLQTRRTSSAEEARRFAGAILVWVALAGAGLTAVLVALSHVAVAVTGPGLDPRGRESAAAFLHLLAPVALLSAISSVLAAVSQAEERFSGVAIGTVTGSAATLIITVLLWDSLGLVAVALGLTIGPLTTVTILTASLARWHALPRPTLLLSRHQVRTFLAQAAPLTLSGVIGQITVATDRAIASLLAPGAVSALRYGDVVVRTPITAVGPAWSSAIYPAMARTAQEPDRSEFGRSTERAIGFAIVVFVPLAALTAAVAPAAVSTAFERGAFGATDVAATAPVVAAFAPQLAILMISPVLARAHLALRGSRVLLTASVARLILNVVLNVVLGLWLGVAGIALATSLTSLIIIVYFARRLGAAGNSFRPRRLARTAAVATLASAPPAIVVAAVAWGGAIAAGTLPAIAILVASGVLGLAAYVVLATWLGLEEARQLLGLARARLRGPGFSSGPPA